MPRGADGVASHRFPGGHTTGAAMIGSKAQLKAQRELLREAAKIDIAAIGTGEPGVLQPPAHLELQPGERVWFDVLVRNTGTGHAFPGGVRDLRNTVVEADLTDASGELVARSGDGEDAHRLRVMVVDDQASSEDAHQVAHFRTSAFDHTIGPRNAQIVRFGGLSPTESWRGRYGSRLGSCIGDSPRHLRVRPVSRRSPGEGAEFIDATEDILGVRPDACVEQPTTIIARAEGGSYPRRS